MSKNEQLKRIKFRVSGMHCASCEVLIERKFSKLPGVEKVHASLASGKAELFCRRAPDLATLNELVRGHGYSVSRWDSGAEPKKENSLMDYLQIGWMFFMVVALYFILKQSNVLPDIGISEKMSYGVVFLIGLFAAVSSCIAVVGGLLLAVASKYNESHPELSGVQKFRPHIYFNLGRVAGYTVFGGAVGALGSVLTLSARANGLMTVAVSLVMLMLGFQLLNLFPGLRRFSPKMPKFISHRIHDMTGKDSKGAPFALGALTFFLPCGFTQALQLYVLANGDWKTGALTMLVFSLGTMPALLSLSALSSFAKGAFQKHFLRFAGVVIVLLGIFNINNGLTLAGYNVNLQSLGQASGSAQAPDASAVPIVDGKQVVKMKVNGYSYSPNKFTVVEGVPVEWQVDGRNAAGCGRVIVMPTLGVSKYLSSNGITTFSFTPDKTGKIPFNCSMGMMTPGSAFTVVPNTTGIKGAVIPAGSEAKKPAQCDPTTTTCPPTQKLTLEVSNSGISPRSPSVKKGTPVELTIDSKIKLGGCMSVWVIPEYDVTIPINGTKTVSTFTPTEGGPITITCSMGSRIMEINVTE